MIGNDGVASFRTQGFPSRARRDPPGPTGAHRDPPGPIASFALITLYGGTPGRDNRARHENRSLNEIYRIGRRARETATVRCRFGYIAGESAVVP
jgi:hypothetical protein